MADKDRTVRVDINRDLLESIGGPSPKTKDGYIERLVKHRRKFEQIAAHKYDEGEYRAEVGVLVVDITPSDLT
jgi:hypothetical protein